MNNRISTMDLRFASNLRDQLRLTKFLLSYQGQLTQEVSKGLLTLMERKLDNEASDETIKKRVFSAMLQYLQDLISLKDGEGPLHSGLFMVGRQQDEYVILSGSLINAYRVRSMQTMVSTTGEGEQASNQNFFETLIRKSSQLSDLTSQGPLFEITQHSNNRVEFGLENVLDHYVFFSVKISVC